jgi:hypothetical protein
MGGYRQFSNNFHIYTNIVAREMMMPMARDVEATDKYLMRESPNALRRVPVEPPMRKVPLMQTLWITLSLNSLTLWLRVCSYRLHRAFLQQRSHSNVSRA